MRGKHDRRGNNHAADDDLRLDYGCGVFLRKIKVFTAETNAQISKIVLKLTLPVFLISSVLGD